MRQISIKTYVYPMRRKFSEMSNTREEIRDRRSVTLVYYGDSHGTCVSFKKRAKNSSSVSPCSP